MAHVIWIENGQVAKAVLPRSDLPPDAQGAQLLESGRLPFPRGTPHVVISGDHAAAAVPPSQLRVDFATATVSIAAPVAGSLSEADYAEAIQAHIDATAHARGYGHGALLASYVASTVPAWAAEAQTFIKWRDTVWLAAYGLLGAVKAGEAAAPDLPALIGNLPPIVWPAA
jgi:hypothetical protein